MSAILHSLNVHNLHIFYPILMIRALGNAELRVLVRTFISLVRLFFARQEFRVRMFF